LPEGSRSATAEKILFEPCYRALDAIPVVIRFPQAVAFAWVQPELGRHPFVTKSDVELSSLRVGHSDIPFTVRISVGVVTRVAHVIGESLR